MEPEIIKEMIESGLPGADVVIDGDGCALQARIVSEQFQGLNMVKQHQMVYQTLGDKIGADIHALSLQTYTPEEWEKQK
ncbi:MAG: BolA family protein [Gammaproteobacteria bacterium]|jgi:acid stress-induced BolA-like protein IbaG/YrbA